MGDRFGIGEAVKEMRNGQRVRRTGWNGKGMYLFLVAGWEPTNAAALAPHERPALPFVAMSTVDGSIVPWLCSQTDLLATDWEIQHEARQ